jgi:hypothetical protein
MALSKLKVGVKSDVWLPVKSRNTTTKAPSIRISATLMVLYSTNLCD